MHSSEWIVIVYLGYLAAMAWIRDVPGRRRLVVTAVAAVDVAVIAALARASGPAAAVVRDWLPPLQVLVGYWLSGVFFERPMPRAEAWLARWDAWLFDHAGASRFVARTPRLVLELLESAYLSVYLVVPAGFAVALLAAGDALDVDRYWTMVVAAELACYGMLPWIQTRPPRALGDHVEIDRRRLTVRAINLRVLASGSIQVNTVPSGHAAGAVATALAVGVVSPVAGAAFMVLAAGIIAGSVLGRYHYAMDSLLGVLVVAVLLPLV